MPSAFSHAVSAIALGSAFGKKSGRIKMSVIGAVCSVLPDADVLSFKFGIPYESMWGHRGISHSLFFSAVLAILVIIIFYNREKDKSSTPKLFIYFFIATALHPLLDACTNGGLGVALFAPFNNERFFFSFRPIMVSPLSVSAFFTQRGWEIFKSEFFWIWLPSIFFILFMNKVRRST